MRRIWGVLLLIGGCSDAWKEEATDAETLAACAATLDGPSVLTLGSVTSGFAALTSGSTLAVDSGSQGGTHSDLVLRFEGAFADARIDDGLLLESTIVGGWRESVTLDAVPRCRNPGVPGYYALARIVWQGEEPVLGDDPYDDYYCGYEDEDPGPGLGSLEGERLDLTATVGGDFGASATVEGIRLVEGRSSQEQGG